ncbi:hypothetical protein FOH38_01925 [Lysinibacillus fusiformis]|nr:hypothetical protein FOH38_01925 [Lysinibacillus fusiformis]
MVNILKRGEWFSKNGQWKITYKVFEHLGLVQVDITVCKLNKKSGLHEAYFGKDIPEYVKAKFKDLQHYVQKF